MCRSKAAPPDEAPSRYQPGGRVLNRLKLAERTFPYRPSAMAPFNQRHCGQNRMHMAGMKYPELACMHSSSAVASALVRAMGFSHNTCLPVFTAAVATARWRVVG